ncbi:hypothetical protein NF867_08330 [Solitalea sp. MAHUQ-68]|uniref:DUF6933 domain-containing protein n=1 Tax=Solitalea agri TaxID=2953739 RepID=A0A9X2F2E7_9SPHI|nr:hypothetical protein [Solitalea agri]MCO4292864.1 hypothetical protein [Solitalea agri]
MIQIFCSQKFAKLLELPSKKNSSINTEESLQAWNAHLFSADRRKCLIFVHKTTLYTFILLDILKKDLKDLPSLFIEGFINQLKTDQLIKDNHELILRKHYDSITLKNTDNDKKVLGSINDYVYQTKFMIEINGGIHNCDANDIGQRLNDTPMGAIKYGFPIDRMREEIENLK